MIAVFVAFRENIRAGHPQGMPLHFTSQMKLDGLLNCCFCSFQGVHQRNHFSLCWVLEAAESIFTFLHIWERVPRAKWVFV